MVRQHYIKHIFSINEDINFKIKRKGAWIAFLPLYQW